VTRKNILGFLMVGSLLTGQALAEDAVVGFVKIAEGDTSIIDGQINTPAKTGMPLHLGSIIKTGSNGQLGATFKDNTVMSFGPDTEVVIDEYLFAPADGSLKLSVNMLKGTLQYISGVIAKLKPEAVSVKTPAGIIGVRGTRFLAKTEAE
jgi:hypothetical protein